MIKQQINVYPMKSRERLETVFSGGKPDRTPILGGWIACSEHICALTGVGIEKYWNDPAKTSIKAYELLGMDGLIDILVPKNIGDFRIVDANSYIHAQSNLSLNEALAKIDAMPSPEVIEAKFDFDSAYESFKKECIAQQRLCGDMVWMPAQWSAGAKVSWYADFGYESFFYIVGAYPDKAEKLMEIGGARGHCQSRLIARAVKEGLYPHAVLLGEDICTQRGPMISPDFIEQCFAPSLCYGLQPLLEVGCKPVWHCDGDVRKIIDILIDCGVQGLQGFQPECGMNIEYIAQKRNRDGLPLLIFGPLSVTTELPVCTSKEIRNKVRHAIDVCRGNADLVLFTANTINPDVPLDNIRAMYETVLEE